MGTWVERFNADEAVAKQEETARYQLREKEYKREGNNKAHRSKVDRKKQAKAVSVSKKRNRK